MGLNVIVQCAASDHAMTLNLDSDEYMIYLSLYIGRFYEKQQSFMGRLRERLWIIMKMLLGREYQFEDIVLEKEAIDAVAKFFLEVQAQAKVE